MACSPSSNRTGAIPEYFFLSNSMYCEVSYQLRLCRMHFQANPNPSQSKAFEDHSLTASIETRLPKSGQSMLRGLNLASHFSRAKFSRIASSILLIFLADVTISRLRRRESLTPRSSGGAFGSFCLRRWRSLSLRAAPFANCIAKISELVGTAPAITGNGVS